MRAVSILSFLALSSFAAAARVESRSSPSESYSLYAYGEGVGGLSLYYSEGKPQRHDPCRRVVYLSESNWAGNAVIGKKAPPNSTEVICKKYLLSSLACPAEIDTILAHSLPYLV